MEVNQQGSPYQVCISPGEDGDLDTLEEEVGGDDQIEEITFTYSEDEWLLGTTWVEKMRNALEQ